LGSARACSALTPSKSFPHSALRAKVDELCYWERIDIACVKRNDLAHALWFVDESNSPVISARSQSRDDYRKEFFGLGLSSLVAPRRRYASVNGIDLWYADKPKHTALGQFGLLAYGGLSIQRHPALRADGTIASQQFLVGLGATAAVAWEPPVVPVRIDVGIGYELMLNRSATTIGARGNLCLLLGPLDACGSAAYLRVPDIYAEADLHTSLSGRWLPFVGGSVSFTTWKEPSDFTDDVGDLWDAVF
jgi:hypothetical protein